ncbi:PROTEIN HEAT-STRESS-ASSOCIATED 32 [Salix purpurea]|uniref:PROTEIN HEAT-STRESS-ASSOCIATED 32 n=1 Tax=Salix purpurea TaxID=77065 RepID=A0A9Q0WLV4_SALPP|nr:PROTEIN HEAT-STRESS-ASSOCIATED 32 [Salix purpurea]
MSSSSVYYQWKSFEEHEDRPEKPRGFGVTEMRGPQYTILSQNMLQDVFETVGQFVDGLKFSGGSHSLMPKSFIKEVIDMAHRHDVYVSTGDWAEHLLHKGPTAFKENVKAWGLTPVELNVGSLGSSLTSQTFPIGGHRGFGAYVPPAPRSSEMVEDVNLLINMAERCLEAGADMIMIDADDICKDADSLRADIIAKVIGRLGLEKTMFEASNTKTADWFIKHYGPKVNLFVDHSQVTSLECLRGRSNMGKREASALGSSYFLF